MDKTNYILGRYQLTLDNGNCYLFYAEDMEHAKEQLDNYLGTNSVVIKSEKLGERQFPIIKE